LFYLAKGDFNADGIEDVVTYAYPNRSITVFQGSGQGYFNAGVPYSTGLDISQVAVGDVNGDGIPDIAAVAIAGYTTGTPKDVSISLGNGNGTFQSAITSSLAIPHLATNGIPQIYLVDVNHDGKADLIGNWGVALGHGDGTFAAPVPFPSTTRGISAIATGDFNRDGNVDLLVGSLTPGTIYTLLGDGKGGFSVSHQEILNYTKASLYTLTTWDMNGDGIPDLIYLYSASPSSGRYDRVVVELGDGAGNFGNETGVRLTPASPYSSLVIADYNRDGKPDVLDLNPFAGNSALLRGSGDGTLTSAQYFSLQMPAAVAMDMNGDGAPDVVGLTSDTVGIARALNTGAR
jgi:hypothetical protein